MDTDTDPHALDVSVERFIAKQDERRYRGSSPSTSTTMHAAPIYAEADDLGGDLGGSLRMIYPHGHRQVSFMPVDLARDLAAAINGVLMTHAGLTDAETQGLAEVRKDVAAYDASLPDLKHNIGAFDSDLPF